MQILLYAEFLGGHILEQKGLLRAIFNIPFLQRIVCKEHLFLLDWQLLL